MKKQKLQFSAGYSVLELLFYISIFAVLSIVVINSLITMTRSFRESAVFGELVQSGNIVEKISREIRSSLSISTITTNDLKLNTKNTAGNSKTVEFLLSGNNIQYLENNVLTGNLNTPTIAVTALSFTQITTTLGVAVKISLTVKSTNDPQARTYDFYDTVVLRGAY
jgi:hypothetical protein